MVFYRGDHDFPNIHVMHMGLHYEQRCSTHRRGRTSKVSGLHTAWDLDWKWKLRRGISLSGLGPRSFPVNSNAGCVSGLYEFAGPPWCIWVLGGTDGFREDWKGPRAGISHLCISTSGHDWEDPEGLSRELTCFRVCLIGCVWGYQCWVSHHAVGTRCRGLS